jgi:hypothetical protein
VRNRWKFTNLLLASQLQKFSFAGFKRLLVGFHFHQIITSDTFLTVYCELDLSDDHVCFGLEVVAFGTGARCDRWIDTFLLAFKTFYVFVAFFQVVIIRFDP